MLDVIDSEHSPRSKQDVAEQADAIVVIAEWDEFRSLSRRDLGRRMRGIVLLDLRNIYDQLEGANALDSAISMPGAVAINPVLADRVLSECVSERS